MLKRNKHLNKADITILKTLPHNGAKQKHTIFKEQKKNFQQILSFFKTKNSNLM
jgi:hypothetical protein